MIIKQRSLLFMFQKRSQKGSYEIWWISNSFLKYSKPAIPPLFNGPELLSSASDKATLSVEIFSKTLILMIELVFCFFSRIDLKLCNSFVILEIIIEVIAALRCFILFVFQCYFWRVVLKKSHIYLLIFPTYVWLNLVLWKLYSVVPYFL